MHLQEETISSELIYEGRILKLTKDRVKLEDGTYDLREVVHHNGGVCVAPITKDGKFIFVRQFRYPFKKVLIEFPAGKREGTEDCLQGAKRELYEEVGAIAEEWTSLGEMYPTVAYDSEIIHLYMAKELTFKEAQPDEGEFIELEFLLIEDAYNMVIDGNIKDAKTIIMILRIHEILKNK